jgi:hypothetical protein
MSQEFIYPYTETGGVQITELLHKGQIDYVSAIITGASGRILHFEASPKEVVLKETDINADYWMYANIDNLRYVSFDLHTRKHGTGSRLFYQPFDVHPDLFAAKFVGVCIDHFEKTGEVQGLRGKWHSRGVNFKQFMTSYLQDHDKVKAAKSTWSGRTYASYGFGDISDDSIFMHIDQDNPMIDTLFKKG